MSQVEILWVVVLMWPFVALHVEAKLASPSIGDRPNLFNRAKINDMLSALDKLGRLNMTEIRENLRPLIDKVPSVPQMPQALNGSIPSPTLPKAPSADDLPPSPAVPSIPSIRELMLAAEVDSTEPVAPANQTDAPPSSESDTISPPETFDDGEGAKSGEDPTSDTPTSETALNESQPGQPEGQSVDAPESSPGNSDTGAADEEIPDQAASGAPSCSTPSDKLDPPSAPEDGSRPQGSLRA